MSNQQNISSQQWQQIELYVSGKMSREEMYAFEKVMQQDDFLADAVEGYMTSDVKKAAKDLVDIEAAILPEEKKKRVIPIFWQSNYWLSAAAIIFIIALVGIVFYSQTKKEKAVVTNKSQPKKTTLSPKVDTTSVATTSSNQKIDNTKAKNSSKHPIPSKQITEVAVTSNTFKDSSINLQIDAKNTYAKVDAERAKSSSLEEVAKKEQTKDVAYASPKTEINSNQPIPPSVRSKRMYKNFGNNNIQESASLNKRGKSQTSDTINAKNDLSEVVVIGYGTVRKQDVTGSVSSIKSSDISKRTKKPKKLPIRGPLSNQLSSIQLSSAKTHHPIPTDGMNNLEDYLTQQIDSLKKDVQHTLPFISKSGTPIQKLELSFFIDKKGNPYRVKVLTDIDKASENALIKLIEKATQWTGLKKHNLLTIDIE